MNNELIRWRKLGKHLPSILKDFHQQKRVFKTMHEITDGSRIDKCPDWITGHIYIIDMFLWFMARHGYTLQKSRANIEFEDLETNIKTLEKREAELFSKFLKTKQNEKSD